MMAFILVMTCSVLVSHNHNSQRRGYIILMQPGWYVCVCIVFIMNLSNHILHRKMVHLQTAVT